MSSELKTDVIINRDALYALRELPGESVNCCVTSPPYYALKEIRKARPSIRAQLKADKEKTTPKKAAAKSKNHDLEV